MKCFIPGQQKSTQSKPPFSGLTHHDQQLKEQAATHAAKAVVKQPSVSIAGFYPRAKGNCMP